MAEELTQEEVFANDIDPLDAIRELRKEEGVPEEDLPQRDEAVISEAAPPQEEPNNDLDAFAKDEPAPESATSEGDADELQESSETQEGETDQEAAEEIERLTFKANGQDFHFTPEEVVDQFETVFGQAMDYTKKMQQIAPYRKMISALETEGVSQEQLNLAIDALKGDKGALNQIISAHEIDKFDLGDTEENPYTPKSYGKDEQQLAIEEVVSSISQDEEYKITVDVVDNQWDSASRQEFANNPAMIQGLHNDIKSGLYDQVAPAAMKMKVLDGNNRSDIEYYMLAGQQLAQNQQANQSQQQVDQLNQQTQDAVQNAGQASSEAQQKRAASSTRARADRKGVTDYLDDNDENFDAWYKNLMASN